MQLQLDEDEIVWPGGSRSKPTGLMIPTHLKVLTILEQPFVYARKLGSSSADANADHAHSATGRTVEKAKVNWGDFADVLSGDGDDGEGYSAGGGGSGAGGKGANRNGEGGGDELPENSCDLAKGEIPCPIYDKRMAADGRHLFLRENSGKNTPNICQRIRVSLCLDVDKHCLE